MSWKFRRDRAPFEMEKFPRRIHSEVSIAVKSWNTWACGVGRKSSPVQKTSWERLENHRVTINVWVKMDSKAKTESRSLLLSIIYEKNYSPSRDLPICIYQLSISSMMIRLEDDPHISLITWSQNFKDILEITISNFHLSSGSRHPFPFVLTSQPLI